MRNKKLLLTLLSPVLLALAVWQVSSVSASRVITLLRSGTSNKPSRPQLAPARSGGEVRVRAAGRGTPWVNLSDGIELQADYEGTPDVAQGVASNRARSLSLSSADFDEDGVPDLVTGSASEGVGIVTLYRGNRDSLDPNSPIARQRKARGEFLDSPFLPKARVFDLPLAPEFLAAGDYDNDGHADLVAAARGNNALCLMRGDGRGSFGMAETIVVPGSITALVSGEINRADGLADLVVGIASEAGNQVLVFESPEGALRSELEVIPVPRQVSGLALGLVDEQFEMDLVVASGNEVILVHGRDRTLSLGRERQSEEAPLLVESVSLPFDITSIALGDFRGRQVTDIAMLTADGTLFLLKHPNRQLAPTLSDSARSAPETSIRKWKRETLAAKYWSQATALHNAKVSSIPGDDLLIVDPTGSSLHIITNTPVPAGEVAAELRDKLPRPEAITLDTESAPVAVLPMRLNNDALADLVILRSDWSAPAVVMNVVVNTFVVTNTNDAGTGSLRQAIIDANQSPGEDAIQFKIGATGSFSIVPRSPLPPITEALTIDGLSQPGGFSVPVIEINGTNAGATPGLRLAAPNCKLNGLVINRFSQQGVVIEGTGGCVVERCRIGTDTAGTQALPNGSGGLLINGSPNNGIGSTVEGSGNLISGNTTTGVLISNNGAAGNKLEGNLIGTNFDGTLAVGNTLSGVRMDFTATNNVIGGTAAGAGNVVSGNNAEGMSLFTGAVGNLIQGNRIGTSAGGSSGISNGFEGVLLQDTASNTIGGTAAGARNVISANIGSGVRVGAGSVTANTNLIQGNLIGFQADGVGALPNIPRGVIIEVGNGNLIGGAAAGAGNKIGFHALQGILVFAGTGNTISRNSIDSNTGLGIDLLPQGVTPNDAADADTGPNNLQNFPVLISAIASGTNVAIRGKIDSAPQTAYTIEFFRNTACDASGNGEGQDFIGQTAVTTDSAGTAAFNVTFAAAVSVGNIITSTATNNTTGDTSEFSQCAVVTDPPVLNIGDATVTEGNAGTTNAIFAVTLSFQSAQDVSVQFATQDNTAQAPGDYVSNTGTLTFPPGATTQNITVQVNGDTLNEPDETFFVKLSAPVNATIADGQGLGTIVNDDAQPTLSINDVSVNEGNAGTTNAVFTVTLSQASGKTITVDFATADSTATAGSDYVAASGRLTFAPGETSKNIVVSIIGDTLFEPDETFFVNLLNPVNATIQRSQGIGTIFNDDVPPAGILQFSASNFGVSEGGLNATITVTGTISSEGAVTVNFATSNGTATAGADYTATSGTLNFASGQTSATFNVPIIEDSLVEGPETVNLTLNSPTGGAVLGSPSSAVLTIIDNDVPQHGALQFSAENYRASETAGSAVITVVRAGGSDGPVSVNFSTGNGTATAGSDYTATSGTLSFGDGETSKTFSVTILDDTIVEGDETVNLTLSNPTGSATLGSPATATLTILDDETPTPEINGITPSFGDPTGGDFIVISGRNFTPGSTVRFGNNLASDVTVVSDGVITCKSPSGTGTVTVSATTSRGTATLGNAFTYVAGAVPGTQLDWFSPNAVNAAPAAQLDPPRDLSASRVTTSVPGVGRSPQPSVARSTWPQVSTPNLLGYNVYRSSDPNFQVTDTGAQRIANLPAGVTDYFDPDIAQAGAQIAASTTPVFFYRVTAVYDQGESLPTQVASTGIVITGVSLRQTAGRTTLVVQGVSLATFRAQVRVAIGTAVTTIRKTRFPKEGRLGNGTSSVIEVDIPPIPAGACLLMIQVINPGSRRDLSDAQFSPPFLFSLGCVPGVDRRE